MNFKIRALLIAGLSLAACCAVQVCSQEDSWISSSMLASLQGDSQRLDLARKESDRRIAAGAARINDLASGRAFLVDVAAEFLALHKDQPGFLMVVGRTW